jgi:RNA-directed DNA polymerase
MRELKEVFRRHRSQLIGRVINLINPMLRGWVNYFAVGHSSECFSFVKDWVEKGHAPAGTCLEAKGLRLGTME